MNRFPLDVVTALFPDPMEEHRKEQEAKAREDATRRRTLISECLDAMVCLADAMRHPDIASPNLEHAIGHIKMAHEISIELDPPFEDDEQHPRPSTRLMTEDQRLDGQLNGGAIR